uniref:Alpha-farnesene synthase n=1 Tax=Vitis vinifera TaxID=29760 RepID=F6I240_VITVI
MDSANHIQNSQEFLQCQAKSEGVGTISQRRSANYKPNIWKYDCVQSLTSEYMGEPYTRQVQQLKGEVRRVFVEVVEPLAKLEFIDSIKKLGLGNFFEEEIREALDTIMSDKNNSPGIKANLYAAALCFRLLRQHGYGVSQDMFSGFMEEVGMFSKSTCTNVKGMIELFEASHLALEGENILDEAKAFSSGYLKEIISNLDNNLAKQVVHSLERPLHWRVQCFDIRWYIDFYEEEGVMNLDLLKLAKLNFNMVQAVHQKDLKHISSNAWISSSVSLLSVHAIFFCVPHEAKEEMVDFLEKNQELVYSSSLILRLCNDLGTLEAELERGDAASSVLCYMKEVNVSEEISRTHIRGMIVKTWKNMNGHCIASSPLLQPVVNIITNIARVAQWIYQYGDGLGIPDRETKAQILSLLIEPLGIN